MKPAPRERVLNAAEVLFMREGIVQVTVDAIAAEAETTKMTVYRHFESKDALVLLWLDRVVERYAAFWASSQAVDAAPEERLLRFARFIADDLESASYRGCPFVNTLAELSDPQHPGRLKIQVHKAQQFRRLSESFAEAGREPAEALAAELTMLLEGAQVAALNQGFDRVASRMMWAAERIVRGA